jgi:hypothetical protein
MAGLLMLEDDILRPIKIFGTVLFVIGFFGIIFDFIYLNDPEVSTGFKIFGVIISMWHLLGGIGILLKKIWGFYIFKSYLHVSPTGIMEPRMIGVMEPRVSGRKRVSVSG